MNERSLFLSGLDQIVTSSPVNEEICALIDGLPTLEDFDFASLQALARYMEAYRARTGTVLFREGEDGDFMGLIVDGKVDVYKIDSSQARKTLISLGRGKIFGEMAIIDEEPRSATAVVAQPTTLVILTKTAFARIMDHSPDIGVKILLKLSRLLSQRLRRTSGMLVEHLTL